MPRPAAAVPRRRRGAAPPLPVPLPRRAHAVPRRRGAAPPPPRCRYRAAAMPRRCDAAPRSCGAAPPRREMCVVVGVRVGSRALPLLKKKEVFVLLRCVWGGVGVLVLTVGRQGIKV